MNREGASNGTWEYRHDTSATYWFVAAPAGTTAAELKRYDLPEVALSSVQSCLDSGDAFMLLAEAAESSCLHPIVAPDIPDLFAIRKRSGEVVTFTLRRDKGSSWLAELR